MRVRPCHLSHFLMAPSSSFRHKKRLQNKPVKSFFELPCLSDTNPRNMICGWKRTLSSTGHYLKTPILPLFSRLRAKQRPSIRLRSHLPLREDWGCSGGRG